MKAPKEAVALAKKTGDKRCLASAQFALGEMSLVQGRNDDALRAAGDAKKNLQSAGDNAGVIRCDMLLAQVHCALEDFPKALEFANGAVQACHDSNEQATEYAAQQILAAIQERQGGAQQRPHIVQQADLQTQSAQHAAESLDLAPPQKAGMDPVV